MDQVQTDQSILMTVQDVADVLGMSVTFVRREIRSLKLPAKRVGRVVRVLRTDLEKYLQELPDARVEFGGTK